MDPKLLKLAEFLHGFHTVRAMDIRPILLSPQSAFFVAYVGRVTGVATRHVYDQLTFVYDGRDRCTDSTRR